MINEQIKLITNELEKIRNDYIEMSNELERKQEEVDDLGSQLVNHVTSTEYNIGLELVMYGKIYKAINNSDNMVTCLKNLHKLYSDDLFDGHEDLIDEVKNRTIKFMETEKFNDTLDTWCDFVQVDLLNDVLYRYITETMLRKI